MSLPSSGLCIMSRLLFVLLLKYTHICIYTYGKDLLLLLIYTHICIYAYGINLWIFNACKHPTSS